MMALRESSNCVFFTEEANPVAVKCRGQLLVSRIVLHGLNFFFYHLNRLNISFQSKGGDILTAMGKINVFKLKVEKWRANVKNDFFFLMSQPLTTIWEHGKQALEQILETQIPHLIASHLTLIQKNLDLYNPSKNDKLTTNILNHFSDELTHLSDALLELRTNYTKKAAFKTSVYRQATAMFVQMLTSCLCEQGISALVLVKSRKGNAILIVDPLIQGTFESHMMP